MDYTLNLLYTEKNRLLDIKHCELEKDEKNWLVIIEAENKIIDILNALDILEDFS